MKILDLTTVEIDGAKLKEARGVLGLSDAARRLGTSRQNLFDYEKNDSRPSANIMARACILYKRPIKFFVKS